MMTAVNWLDVEIPVIDGEPLVVRRKGIDVHGTEWPEQVPDEFNRWYEHYVHRDAHVRMVPAEGVRVFCVSYQDAVPVEEAERVVASFVAAGWSEVPYRDEGSRQA